MFKCAQTVDKNLIIKMFLKEVSFYAIVGQIKRLYVNIWDKTVQKYINVYLFSDILLWNCLSLNAHFNTQV